MVTLVTGYGVLAFPLQEERQNMFDEDEKGIGSDVKSGDEEGTPVHSPTIPEDEGNPGDGTGEGNAGPASGTSGKNPAAPEVDHL